MKKKYRLWQTNPWKVKIGDFNYLYDAERVMNLLLQQEKDWEDTPKKWYAIHYGDKVLITK